MSLCLAAGLLTATLGVDSFTLAWAHSIEKIRWEEDWHVEGTMLVLAEARIRGTGAGMEPPPGAILDKGVWHYRPALPAQRVLRLAHSPYTAGYELCLADHCAPLADRLPGIDPTTVVELSACQQ